jgi:hypothetical protein
MSRICFNKLSSINASVGLLGLLIMIRRVFSVVSFCCYSKSDEGARVTLAAVELWSMIKNGKLDNLEDLSVWDEFYALAA